MTLFRGFIDALRNLFYSCLSDQESTEFDEIDGPEELFADAPSGADEWNEMEDTSEDNSENEEEKETSSLQKMLSLPEPILVKEASDPPTPPVTHIKVLPSVRPVRVNQVPPTSTLPAVEIRPVIRPLLSAAETVRVYRTSRHLRPPAVEIRSLPAVEEPSLADRIFPESVAPAGGMRTLPSVKEPLLVRQNPTPVTDEVIYLTSSASFQPSEEQKPMIQVDRHNSLFDSTPQAILMDIDIENEFVEYTGRRFTRGEMKTTHHKALENGMKHPLLKAAVKPKAILCWREEADEVREPVPPIQIHPRSTPDPMDKIQDITDEDESNSEEEECDSRKETDVAPQKPRDQKIRLFHVNPSYRPKTETQQLKTWKKRNGPLEWAEQKVWKKVEKKRRKEKMLLQRQQLHERYLHDPKLKHLWINKHNRFNSSVHYEV